MPAGPAKLDEYREWLVQKDAKKSNTAWQYGRFLIRCCENYPVHIDEQSVAEAADVKGIRDRVEKIVARRGRFTKSAFNEYDVPRNFIPALKAYLRFVQSKRSSSVGNDFPEDELPQHVLLEIERVIRDTVESRKLKELYNCRCQICGETLPIGKAGRYAEVHHLKGIGKTRGGPDTRDNMLCVCPNHHALLDYAAIRIDPATLNLKKHNIRPAFIEHHNARFDVVNSNREVKI